MTTQTTARPLFAATLTPHRSLSHRGLRYLIAGVAVAASIPGMVMFAMGAWPVVGFLGLDVLAVWWALSVSMREKKRYEKVTLWPDELELMRVDARGREELIRYDPRIVKLIIDRDFNERTTALHLRTTERDIEIGSFLNPDDKQSFGKALGTALRQARHTLA
jgi:uncharacterized membrane protein